MHRRAIVTAAAAVAALALGASPAHAASNGAKAYQWDGTAQMAGPCVDTDFNTLPGGITGGALAFSPSGRYMTVSNGTTLWVMDVDRCLEPRDIGAGVEFAAWSPDGKRLAVSRDGDILVIDPVTGATIRQLTATPARDHQPVWTRDGKTVTYTTDDGLHNVGADGTGDRLLVRDAYHADYSPTGRWLSYSLGDRLYVANADGSQPRKTAIRTGEAVWSPDGKFFFLSSVVDGDCVTATTSGRIVSREGRDIQPDQSPCTDIAWQPAR